jgi:CheY-like chemotaxis protein
MRLQAPDFVAAPIRAHVLIVEDEQTNAAVAQGYLSALGCTSVWVESGDVAVARIAIERFDVILMDLNMPKLDGYEATALIRKAETPGNRTIVIAVTANSAELYRESCLAAGMDDILMKPYALPELAETLQRHVVHPSNDAALAAIDAPTVESLRRVAGTQTDLYPRLVSLFIPSSTASLAQLGDALDAGDLAAGAMAAHKLKASAANVGALAFSAALAQLEVLCTEKNVEAARATLSRLMAVHSLLIEKLQIVGMRASA